MRELLSKLKDELFEGSTYDKNGMDNFNSLDKLITELEAKIIEVEKRLECIDKCAQEINSAISNYTERVDNNEVFVMSVTHHDSILRGSNDVMIACDLSDDEPIINNWVKLFEEPEEEARVLIPKDSIVEWKAKTPTYSAEGGATAKVTKDYTNKCDFLFVEFLDEKASGQENGGYSEIQFNVISTPIGLSELIKEEVEVSHGGIPYRVCKHCGIKEEEIVMHKVGEDWECNDCNAPTELCKTPQTHEFVKDIIAKLKVIDVDGETMEYIIEQVGMSEQMLRQLVMKNDYKVTKDLLREKFELDL